MGTHFSGIFWYIGLNVQHQECMWDEFLNSNEATQQLLCKQTHKYTNVIRVFMQWKVSKESRRECL